MKTFWTGIDGWADQQLPDGTVIWTSPTGKTYKTLPGSRIFFPSWDTTTAALPPRDVPEGCVNNRTLMMPRRRRTRAADRARRIREERALNAAQIAESAINAAPVRTKPPPDDLSDIDTRSDACDEPPPF